MKNLYVMSEHCCQAFSSSHILEVNGVNRFFIRNMEKYYVRKVMLEKIV